MRYETAKVILRSLDGDGGATVRQVSERSGLCSAGVRRYLAELVDRGEVLVARRLRDTRLYYRLAQSTPPGTPEVIFDETR